jgi:hypothetical protein
MAMVAAGCATTEHAAAPVPTHQATRPCRTTHAHGFRTCWSGGRESNPTIERRTMSGWTVITGPLRPPEPSAQWGEVSLSPDNRTLLAEWEYPCDSAAVVFVSAKGGKPRLVTGERDWRRAPVGRALGWTHNGKARVRIYTAWRGHSINPRHPRVFLFEPHVAAHDTNPAAQSGC